MSALPQLYKINILEDLGSNSRYAGGSLASLFPPLSSGPMMPDLGKAPLATGYRKELAAMCWPRAPGLSPQTAVEGAWLTQPHTTS